MYTGSKTAGIIHIMSDNTKKEKNGNGTHQWKWTKTGGKSSSQSSRVA